VPASAFGRGYCSYNAPYDTNYGRFSVIFPMKAASRVRTPTTVKRTVRRGRRPNTYYRTREYLTEKEVERLMKAAGRNRYGHRDATMILLAFRHGLRASELSSLRWEQVDLAHARLHVSRLKSGIPAVHPLTGSELRALRRLQREQEPSRYLFLSERGAPMSAVDEAASVLAGGIAAINSQDAAGGHAPTVSHGGQSKRGTALMHISPIRPAVVLSVMRSNSASSLSF
jgi:type 1 fimbriae regulatory protein FimB/type 1 fimbriae regulatory protein FimE